MQLPLKLAKELMETKWKSIIDPFLSNPTNNISILNDVVLINGVTVIDHKLGRNMQGWFLVDINAAATIYRSAPLNDKTLTLTSNAVATVSLGVF